MTYFELFMAGAAGLALVAVCFGIVYLARYFFLKCRHKRRKSHAQERVLVAFAFAADNEYEADEYLSQADRAIAERERAEKAKVQCDVLVKLLQKARKAWTQSKRYWTF